MKSGPLKKPPPLILPVPGKIKTKSNEYSKPAQLKDKEKTLEEKAVHKFTTRYDSYQGLLKRVSEMKLSGSLDSEEPSTESESSSVRTRSSRSSHDRHFSGCSSSYEEASRNNSPYGDDESPPGSFDNIPPYEEIPQDADGYDLPPPPPVMRGSIVSVRDSLPSPPTDRVIYSNEIQHFVAKRKSSRPSSVYSNSEIERQSYRIPRPTSLYSNNTEPAEYTNQCSRRIYSNSNPEGLSFTETNKVAERLSPTSDDVFTDEVSDAEKLQIETFFRGLRTQLYISSSLANLYVCKKGSEEEWKFRSTGIPVVILESGDTRSRVKKRIQILLAERGTCFPLWNDTIDNLSAYQKSASAFHTMCLSSDHRQVVGLSFNSAEEADRMLEYIERLTANPENINISVPSCKKKKSPKPKKPAPLPQKAHISTPCFFQHVTSVAARDKPIYFSLQNFVDKNNLSKSESLQ